MKFVPSTISNSSEEAYTQEMAKRKRLKSEVFCEYLYEKPNLLTLAWNIFVSSFDLTFCDVKTVNSPAKYFAR